ncbi:MAG: 3'-5' exonuclease [Rubrivivax sp.]
MAISTASLAGEPLLQAVLPAFARFCGDTVLVAHNAAFDPRFLELARARTGVAFEQPVLDTMLLSVAALPGLGADEHHLEQIAARLGVPAAGRHQALGDALITARVFLKLLPLLAARGIVTLGQAREASRAVAGRMKPSGAGWRSRCGRAPESGMLLQPRLLPLIDAAADLDELAAAAAHSGAGPRRCAAWQGEARAAHASAPRASLHGPADDPAHDAGIRGRRAHHGHQQAERCGDAARRAGGGHRDRCRPARCLLADVRLAGAR